MDTARIPNRIPNNENNNSPDNLSPHILFVAIYSTEFFTSISLGTTSLYIIISINSQMSVNYHTTICLIPYA